MAFNYYSITASTYMVHKISNVVNHILHKPRDLTCLKKYIHSYWLGEWVSHHITCRNVF